MHVYNLHLIGSSQSRLSIQDNAVTFVKSIEELNSIIFDWIMKHSQEKQNKKYSQNLSKLAKKFHRTSQTFFVSIKNLSASQFSSKSFSSWLCSTSGFQLRTKRALWAFRSSLKASSSLIRSKHHSSSQCNPFMKFRENRRSAMSSRMSKETLKSSWMIQRRSIWSYRKSTKQSKPSTRSNIS